MLQRGNGFDRLLTQYGTGSSNAAADAGSDFARGLGLSVASSSTTSDSPAAGSPFLSV